MEKVILISAIVLLVIYFAVRVIKSSKQEKVKLIKDNMLYWVKCAEDIIGSGKGRIKLQLVYGMFVKTFPVISTFISFDKFSKWVDEALKYIEEELKK